jgi:hypothetical protein
MHMKGAKATTYLAVGMMAGGFLLIVLAWNGAASIDYVQGQLPYLISGGVAGIGLIIGGIALSLVQEMRRCTAVLVRELRAGREMADTSTDTDEQNMPEPRRAADDQTEVIEREPARA